MRNSKRISETEVRRVIGQNVGRFRKDRTTLNQYDFSERCGFHRTYVGRVERGEANSSIRSLVMIANELGVSLVDLISSPKS